MIDTNSKFQIRNPKEILRKKGVQGAKDSRGHLNPRTLSIYSLNFERSNLFRILCLEFRIYL